MATTRRGAGTWRAFAVLEHTLAGGSRHFDWLLDEGDGPPDPESRRVRAFRCADPPARILPGGELGIEPMAAHRAFYLTLNGPTTLSDGRGIVRPHAHGQWRVVGAGPRGALTIEVRSSDRTDTLRVVLWPDSLRALEAPA